VNEFQDESNESLDPQAESNPVADDSVEDVQQQDPAEATESPEASANIPTEDPVTEPVAEEEVAEEVEEEAVEEEAVSEAEPEPEPVAEEEAVEEVEEEAVEEEAVEEVEEEAVEEEAVSEAEPEPEPVAEEEVKEEAVEEEVAEEAEDAPFDPHNIPKKYDSQTFEWYILKVQVNRETSIRDGLLRRIKMEGLDDYFEEVIVPTEDIVEFTRSGKRKVVKRKLYPGYIMVRMMLQDDSWFLVRETPGIGDFTGTFGKPTPMPADEVERILKVAQPEEDTAGDEPQLKTAIPFKPGDRVRVKDGNFQNFEGEVDGIDEANGRVTLIINIFGRSTPVELEHWQIEEI